MTNYPMTDIVILKTLDSDQFMEGMGPGYDEESLTRGSDGKFYLRIPGTSRWIRLTKAYVTELVDDIDCWLRPRKK